MELLTTEAVPDPPRMAGRSANREPNQEGNGGESHSVGSIVGEK